MSQILDLIKNNAVPAAVMRSAAKGALSVPAAEMLQILVFLTHNPLLGQEAAMTLAGWDEGSALAVLSSSDAPQEVLDYFWEQKNRRAGLMPALLDNPRITEQRLIAMARLASREMLNSMLASGRVRSAPAVLQVLLANPHLTAAELDGIRGELSAGPGHSVDLSSGAADPEAEAAHQAWEQEHAAEIASEKGKEFELITSPDEPEEVTVPPPSPEATPSAASPQPVQAGATAESEKTTVLTKISRMNTAQRVKAAFTGNRDERAILIRDGARVVQNAVLASPKLTEPEVETFAAAKNVDENVLREIARNRRFIKVYAVQRNLVQNPKCPVEISLALVKNLLVYDLKTLRHSRNVPDVIRQVAANLYREKMTPQR